MDNQQKRALPVVVQKFGGTSVGSIERIRDVAKLIQKTAHTQRNVVVVSAMAGQTNKLVELASQMSPRPQPEAYDMVIASGEQVSAGLLSMALTDLGLKAIPLLGFQVGIETDEFYSNAKILAIREEILRGYLDEGYIPVVAGFQGIHRGKGRDSITTLGRGGSDTTAVALAAGIKADQCDIFTDVDGVYTADPRIVPDAHRIDRLAYSEMMELASLGAKVLHMRCVELAAKYNVKLRVLSTFQPELGGTWIVGEEDMLESPVVSSVTSDSAESLLSLRVPLEQAAYPARFFAPLAEAGIVVDVIVKSPADKSGISTLNFTVPRGQGHRAKEVLAGYDTKIEFESAVKVSIVGIGMRTHSGVAAKMFKILEENQIPIHLITTSEIKVSVLVDEGKRELAIRALHAAFEL